MVKIYNMIIIRKIAKHLSDDSTSAFCSGIAAVTRPPTAFACDEKRCVKK